MGIKKNEKDTADLLNSELLRTRLNPDGSTTTTHTATFLSVRTGGAPKIEGNDITYGEAINIDINNLDDLGLDNDIVTYGMDEDGNFFTELENGMDMDFEERAPQEFLFQMSGGFRTMLSTTVNGETQFEGLEEENFWLRRVEKEGENIGYFITSERDNNHGFYIGTDEIDYANLPDNMRSTLSRPEPPLVPDNEQVTPVVNAPLQTLDVFRPH